jgi:hypothetical protein
MDAVLDGELLGRQAEGVEAHRVQHVEAAHPLEVLDGELLGRQAEGVEAHRVQHVEAAHPLEAGVDVGGDVSERVTDVQPDPRGVGEHVEDVELGAL